MVRIDFVLFLFVVEGEVECRVEGEDESWGRELGSGVEVRVELKVGSGVELALGLRMRLKSVGIGWHRSVRWI